MRHTLTAAILATALLAPSTLATFTTDGVVAGGSVPVAQNGVKYPVRLGPGDAIRVDLQYTVDGVSDLDLLLYAPFYDSVPLTQTILGGDPDAIEAVASHYADQRVGRTTCTDAAAASERHPDGGRESLDAVLPAGAEPGLYSLYVYAFLAVDDVYYRVSITVLDASGRDVTADRLGASEASGVTNPYAYCSAGARGHL